MRKAVFVALLLVPACFEEEGSGDEQFGGPRSGVWVYSEAEPYDDTCMWDGRPKISAGKFDVTNGEDGTFTLIPQGDSGARLDCTLDGSDFVCDDIMDSWDPIIVDALFDYVVQYAGAFEDREHASGDYDVDLACTGTECAVAINLGYVAQLPCTYSVPITAVFLE